jgi:hypothetical protein
MLVKGVVVPVLVLGLPPRGLTGADAFGLLFKSAGTGLFRRR